MAKMCVVDDCTNFRFSNGYCRHHLYLNPKYNKTLTSKKKKPISPVSKKLAENLALYKPIRLQFLFNHPVCQANLPGCTKESTQVHHKVGRQGALLLDTTHFLAVCYNCHRKIEDAPEMAKELGFSGDRTGKH